MANIKREWELTVEWGRALNSYWLSCMFVLTRLDIKYSHAIVIWYINARLRFEFCIYLLVLQFTPSKPGLHSHRYEFTSSMHFPLFRHGVCTQSSISENKQFRDNIYIIQLLFFAKKNIKMRFLVCSIIPYIFYFKVLSLDWQLIYKRILIQWYHLLISQFSPSKPCLHSHRYEFTSSTHFPLFRQSVPSQSSISENKQFRYKCFAETDKN